LETAYGLGDMGLAVTERLPY